MKTGLILVIIALTGGLAAICTGWGAGERLPQSARVVGAEFLSSGKPDPDGVLSTERPEKDLAELDFQDPIAGKQDPQPQGLTVNRFMERKLDAARNIVSGLALEDYEMIAKNAQDLALLSLESQWNLYQTQPYIFMSDEFRGGSQRLRDAANANNLDGATLAYFEVTLSCVRCHKYIRQNTGE